MAHSYHVADDDALRGGEGVTERRDGPITLRCYLKRGNRERAECDGGRKEVPDEAAS